MKRIAIWGSIVLPCLFALACGGDTKEPEQNDEVTLEHCVYEALPANPQTSGTVAAAAVEAGAAEATIDIPVSTALGAYTARAGFLGQAGSVDTRKVAMPGAFNPSIGVESAPKVKVLALEAGAERVVIVKLDVGLLYEGMIFDVEERLGPEYRGKVLMSASHSHSAWGQQTGNFIFQVGLGAFRDLVYQRHLDTIEKVAKEAIAAQRPAKIGIFADLNFDPDDQITRDRRGENDEIMGGKRKDDSMYMIRVDGVDDLPIAALPVYGVHGTLMDEENSFASTDATGGVENWLEEQFDTKVVVMHLQGAGGDVSPIGRGRLDCDVKPGNPDDPCFDWLSIEGHGRNAVSTLYAAWEAAGADMKTDFAMEMMTRSVELGPYPETFTIRDGTLSYAPFEMEREADGQVYDTGGNILSPIDEFNAPIGAALCEAEIDDPESAYPLFPEGLMPGTDLLPPYGACVRLAAAADILTALLKLEGTSVIDETHPVCESTRTTLSALRLGDYVFGTIPGELTLMLADLIREKSPVAKEKTIVLGYSQGHMGYCMTPEDWLVGGYEPSINAWGPLEGEYLAERLVEVMQAAMTPEREEASASSATRVATPQVVDNLPIDNPAPMAGTVPAAVPERVWLRTGPATAAQPSAQINRVTGHATFVWIGDDPNVKTPIVTLEQEVAQDTFEAVKRRSGRLVQSTDVLLMYTPEPLRRVEGEAQTHYWAAEWQAVPWTGMDDGDTNLDGLESRGALPLGKYRFRVQGDAFDITSDPFEVIAAEIGVEASRIDNQISAGLSFHNPRGYRLLDMDARSNLPVPLRSQSVNVTLEVQGQAPVDIGLVQTDGNGNISFDAGQQAADVVAITVVDQFGNSGTNTVVPPE
jgi:neutral ceramidase